MTMSRKMVDVVLNGYYKGELSATEAYNKVVNLLIEQKITNIDAERAAKVLLAA